MSSLLSWSKLGRSAEIEVAILLAHFGWNVRLSPGSRGPADIFAQRGTDKWLIQVKSSRKFGRLKGLELKKLKELAARTGGLPVVALVQPTMLSRVETKKTINVDQVTQIAPEDSGLVNKITTWPTSTLGIFFHSLVDWTIKQPF